MKSTKRTDLEAAMAKAKLFQKFMEDNFISIPEAAAMLALQVGWNLMLPTTDDPNRNIDGLSMGTEKYLKSLQKKVEP